MIFALYPLLNQYPIKEMDEEFKAVETGALLEMLAQHTELYTTLLMANVKGDNFTNISNAIQGMQQELNSRNLPTNTSVSDQGLTFIVKPQE